MFRYYAGDAAGLHVDRANRTGFTDLGAMSLRRAGDCRYGNEGFRASVARRVQATDPLTGLIGDQPIDFAAGQQPRVQLMLFSDVQPLSLAFQICLVFRKVQNPLARESDVCTDLVANTRPTIDAVDDDG